MTVDDLGVTAATTLSYDITAYIISSANSSVQELSQKKFTTLLQDYNPSQVTQIHAKNWTEYYDESEQERRLNFTFTWLPERTHTCTYEVLFYGDDLDLDTFPVSMERLFEYTMSNLKYDTEYSVAIRAINSYDPSKHSHEFWLKFESPEGETPLDVAAAVRHIDDNFFDVNITWNEPKMWPKRYEVDVKDLHASKNKGVYKADVNGVSRQSAFYCFSR